jgi:hypothetical protein
VTYSLGHFNASSLWIFHHPRDHLRGLLHTNTWSAICASGALDLNECAISVKNPSLVL